MNKFYLLISFSFLFNSYVHASLICKYFPKTGPMKKVIVELSAEPELIATIDNVSYFARGGSDSDVIFFIDAFYDTEYDISNAIFTVSGSDYVSVRTYLGKNNPSSFERYLSCQQNK